MDKIGSDKSNNDSLSISNSCHKPRLSTCMAHGFHSLIYYKMPQKVVALILPHHFQRLKKSHELLFIINQPYWKIAILGTLNIHGHTSAGCAAFLWYLLKILEKPLLTK